MVPLRAVAINKPRGKNFTYSIGHCFQFQTSIFTPTRQNCYTLMWVAQCIGIPADMQKLAVSPSP